MSLFQLLLLHMGVFALVGLLLCVIHLLFRTRKFLVQGLARLGTVSFLGQQKATRPTSASLRFRLTHPLEKETMS